MTERRRRQAMSGLLWRQQVAPDWLRRQRALCPLRRLQHCRPLRRARRRPPRGALRLPARPLLLRRARRGPQRRRCRAAAPPDMFTRFQKGEHTGMLFGHGGSVGPCKDPLLCKALRALGAPRAAVARGAGK